MRVIKAYIFDLDGTLLDSMNVWHDIDVNFLRKRRIAVPPDYADAVQALNMREAADYTIKRFGLPDAACDIMDEWNDMAAYAYGHIIHLKPFAKEYLRTLRDRGAPLAVATSLPAALYAPALRNNGIYDFFHALCGADEVNFGKSRPDIFLYAAGKLGARPCDCVVFEDILAAVKCAKDAGMTVCAVYDRASAGDWERIKEIADHAITDYRDAPLII